jgi:thiazole synthase
MPWAAPIGIGQGPRNPRALRELREHAPEVPLIMDAGIGLPSHACQAMEWGFDGILLNTAVSRAVDPVRMAGAFADSIRAGRAGFPAGPMMMQETAVPSTPEIGRPFAFNSSRLPLRQSETKTINSGAVGSVISRRGSGG